MASQKVIGPVTTMEAYNSMGPGTYDTPNEIDDNLKRQAKKKNNDTSFGVSKRNS